MRLARLVLVAVTCAALGTGVAQGATTWTSPPTTTITKGRPLNLGISFTATSLLASSNASTASRWTTKARQIGVQMVRVSASWSSIAPKARRHGFIASNPLSAGYNWTTLDQQLRALSAEHFQVLVTVSNAPTWAEGRHAPSWAQPGTWRPSDVDLRKFAQAIATRYDGSFPDPLHAGRNLPRVSYWQAWNEPNMDYYLSPQYAHEGPDVSHSGTNCPVVDHNAALSPGIYRGLLNAFYAGVTSVDQSNYVVMAGTAPYSVPNCQPGLHNYRMAPVRFDQAVFCLNSSNHRQPGCRGSAHLDAIDNHPYAPPGLPGPCGNSFCPPTWNAPSGDVAVPDVIELRRAVNAGSTLGTVLPRATKGIWVTEIAWDSAPPDPQGEPPQTQAQWLEQAFYLLWKQGVGTILWWQLGDSSPFSLWPDASGEFTAAGAAKPSATAFRFPFVTTRVNPNTVTAWFRAPEAGVVRLEEYLGGSWRTIASGRVSAAEVAQVRLSLPGAALLRAQIGGQTSLTWSQSA